MAGVRDGREAGEQGIKQGLLGECEAGSLRQAEGRRERFSVVNRGSFRPESRSSRVVSLLFQFVLGRLT